MTGTTDSFLTDFMPYIKGLSMRRQQRNLGFPIMPIHGAEICRAERICLGRFSESFARTQIGRVK